MAEEDVTHGIIAISGHRDYYDRAALYRGLNHTRAREYIFGGARGADSDALEYIARSRPGSVRTVVVPNRVIDQPAHARLMIKRHATQVIELRNTGWDRFQIRNRFMVDRAQHLRAFFDFRTRGGTLNTINYARIKGKDFSIYPVRRFNEQEIMGMSKMRFQHWFGTMKDFKVNLSSVKFLIIQYILRVLQMTVRAFIRSLGYVGAMTLEQVWSR